MYTPFKIKPPSSVERDGRVNQKKTKNESKAKKEKNKSSRSNKKDAKIYYNDNAEVRHKETKQRGVQKSKCDSVRLTHQLSGCNGEWTNEDDRPEVLGKGKGSNCNKEWRKEKAKCCKDCFYLCMTGSTCVVTHHYHRMTKPGAARRLAKATALRKEPKPMNVQDGSFIACGNGIECYSKSEFCHYHISTSKYTRTEYDRDDESGADYGSVNTMEGSDEAVEAYYDELDEELINEMSVTAATLSAAVLSKEHTRIESNTRTSSDSSLHQAGDTLVEELIAETILSTVNDEALFAITDTKDLVELTPLGNCIKEREVYKPIMEPYIHIPSKDNTGTIGELTNQCLWITIAQGIGMEVTESNILKIKTSIVERYQRWEEHKKNGRDTPKEKVDEIPEWIARQDMIFNINANHELFDSNHHELSLFICMHIYSFFPIFIFTDGSQMDYADIFKITGMQHTIWISTNDVHFSLIKAERRRLLDTEGTTDLKVIRKTQEYSTLTIRDPVTSKGIDYTVPQQPKDQHLLEEIIRDTIAFIASHCAENKPQRMDHFVSKTVTKVLKYIESRWTSILKRFTWLTINLAYIPYHSIIIESEKGHPKSFGKKHKPLVDFELLVKHCIGKTLTKIHGEKILDTTPRVLTVKKPEGWSVSPDTDTLMAVTLYYHKVGDENELPLGTKIVRWVKSIMIKPHDVITKDPNMDRTVEHTEVFKRKIGIFELDFGVIKKTSDFNFSTLEYKRERIGFVFENLRTVLYIKGATLNIPDPLSDPAKFEMQENTTFSILRSHIASNAPEQASWYFAPENIEITFATIIHTMQRLYAIASEGRTMRVKKPIKGGVKEYKTYRTYPTMPSGAHFLGPFNLERTIVTETEKPFKWNGLFTIHKGHEFFNSENELIFPHDVDYECAQYDTSFMGFAHNGIIYAPSNENMRYGLRRLTCKRSIDDDERGFDVEDMLTRNHHRHFSTSGAQSVRDRLFNIFAEYEQTHDIGYDTMDPVYLNDFVQLPHIKKILRARGFDDLIFIGKYAYPSWMLKMARIKAKVNEIAKNGKYMRVIADLGVTASLQGAEKMKYFKECINCNPIRFSYGDGGGRGVQVVFIAKPEIGILTQWMNRCWFDSPIDDDLILVHGDDTLLSVTGPDNIRRCYNMDIAKCDASHREGIFENLYYILNDEKLTTLMRAKLYEPFMITSTQRLRVVLKAKEPWLPSGDNTTTGLNTSVAYYFAEHFARQISAGRKFYALADYSLLYQEIGYIVEGEVCVKIEDMQFLKHSLVKSLDEEYVATINPGVWMRASGRCFGPLPGKKGESLEERGNAFQSMLIYGLIGNVRCKELEPLHLPGKPGSRELYSKATVKDLAALRVHTDRFNHDVDLNARPVLRCQLYDYFKRYDPTEAELLEFELALTDFGYGVHIYCGLVDKVLKKDYGLRCPLLFPTPGV